MSKKKLMALLLSGVMTATTVSVPVFAEDADAAEDTADAAEETEGGSSDTPLVVGQTNSPRNSVECSQKQFRISRSPIS
ncbi:MAG: hypothetical protein ACLS61_20185 [Ruminococcus sp.]